MISRQVFLVVVCLLLAWSVVARPIYDFVYIAVKRTRDAAAEKIEPPAAAQLYDDVIALNTQTVVELQTYLRNARARENKSPLVGNIDFSSTAAYEASTIPLREELKNRLHFPLVDAIHGNDFSGVQQKPIGEDDVATYTLLSIPALPGVNVIGTLIEPKKHGDKMPLIIANRGRGGMPDRPPSGTIPVMQYTDRDLARGAVGRGWAVFEPIFVFYGKDFPTNIRDMLTMRAQEAGITLTAIEITKVMRAIDYLTTRPEIDTGHLAMIGMSYGGFYTLYTTALDPRVQVAAVAAYFNDRGGIFDSTEAEYGFLDWRFSDSAGLLADPHIVALVCPRPLQIQSGSQDQLFPLEGSQAVLPEARAFYEKLHLDASFDYYTFAGRHDFNGEPAWKFIEQVWAEKK